VTTRAPHHDTSDRETRLRFTRIDENTGTLLREFWRIAEPHLPEILEGFYRHVTTEQALSRMLGDDIPRLKKAQGTHWARLFDGRFDSAYIQGGADDRPHSQQDRTGASLVYRRL
jgi:hypothetical protein